VAARHHGNVVLRATAFTLVSATHHRTGKSHGWIHNELRRVCGGPPVAAANGDQLQERIENLRTWRGP
jgi:hypothetical protein